MNRKLALLRHILEDAGPSLIAFSGGTDSTFLLAVAAGTWKSGVLAVTAQFAAVAPSELCAAQSLARRLGVRHQVLAFVPPGAFWANAPQRCYDCKKKLFTCLQGIARKHGLAGVMDGSHAGDRGDYRPGTKALVELGIRSPLQEAGFTKEDIRRLSRAMHLPTWNRPSLACLASRIPYGQRITPGTLALVGKAEAVLTDCGIAGGRVRWAKDHARIEVPPEYIPLVVRKRLSISRALKRLGFTYVSLDLDGYRTGSLNEVLSWTKKK